MNNNRNLSNHVVDVNAMVLVWNIRNTSTILESKKYKKNHFVQVHDMVKTDSKI